jgi:hypothetical protein
LTLPHAFGTLLIDRRQERMVMPLELESIRKAVDALKGVLARSDDEKLMSRLDETTRNAIRAGVIRHFEITYELCGKFMKKSPTSPSAWTSSTGTRSPTSSAR